MSILKKPYRLSIWKDVWNSTSNKFDEKFVTEIGSDTSQSTRRAFDINLKQQINGTTSLTFSLYYEYNDPISGEVVKNPFVDLLVNETKLKLKYNNEWFDFIIKNVVKDSSKSTINYEATDLFANELSKNGYNVELSTDLENNLGTAVELATKVLEGSGWTIESDSLAQQLNESLICIKLKSNISAYQIFDGTAASGITVSTNPVTINSGSLIYGFYGCCKDAMYRFSFIYTGSETITKDDDRVITNANCQYYIDNPTYTSTGYWRQFGLQGPSWAEWCIEDTTTGSAISTQYRGKRYVFGQTSQFDDILNTYVSGYLGSEHNYWGYTTTSIKAPDLIENYVTNPNTFKTTAGWYGTYQHSETKSNMSATVEAEAINATTGKTMVNEILNNTYSTTSTYTPYLKLTFPQVADGAHAIVRNSGFYDNRTSIAGLSNGEKFVLMYQGTGLENCTVKIGTYNFDAENLYYKSDTADKTYLTFTNLTSSPNSTSLFFATVTESLSAEAFTNSNVQILIQSNANSECIVKLLDFQIFRLSGSESNPMTPYSQSTESTVETKYYYFKKSSVASWTSADQYIYDYVGLTPWSSVTPEFIGKAEQRRAVEIKESNRFNALQEICETFSCWLKFNVMHNTNGTINTKALYLKKYVGDDNYAGFKYGVNLKSIQRTFESKSVVSKLIVKANNNEYATNKMCTIARAASNETGETALYNFDYYFHQGLMDLEQYQDHMNRMYEKGNEDYPGARIAFGKDLALWGVVPAASETTNCWGYYPRLARLNQYISDQSTIVSNNLLPLSQANADVQTYRAALTAAETTLAEDADSFKQNAGYAYNEINSSERAVEVANNTTLYSLLQSICESKTAQTKYQALYDAAVTQQAAYETAYTTAQTAMTNYTTWKNELNQAFYTTYSRFIQEGTWTSDEYTDDEAYYIDAQSVLYDSINPQVSYSISVFELSGLDEYQDYAFKLGDQTFIEDPEFFGYNENGTPYHEAIVVTEISTNLDDPTKNSLKIQNFKDQFADLFHKITATVQSVQYNSSAYTRATDLALADTTYKADFLTDALNSANLVISNIGDQSVVTDKNGITITDLTTPSAKLRLVNSGIMLSKQQADGSIKWATAITANGISADVITAGRIDTSKIQIMNGSESTFLWDSLGLTAYALDDNGAKVSTSGVRFDRFGLYGFTHSSGAGWHPTNITDIKEHSNFGVTSDEFWIKSNDGAITINDTGITVSKKNTSNTTSLTANGLIAISDHLVVTINSADGIKIQQVNKTTTPYTYTDVFYVDDEGKLTYTGSMERAIGKFAGELENATGTLNYATGTYGGMIDQSDTNPQILKNVMTGYLVVPELRGAATGGKVPATEPEEGTYYYNLNRYSIKVHWALQFADLYEHCPEQSANNTSTTETQYRGFYKSLRMDANTITAEAYDHQYDITIAWKTLFGVNDRLTQLEQQYAALASSLQN